MRINRYTFTVLGPIQKIDSIRLPMKGDVLFLHSQNIPLPKLLNCIRISGDGDRKIDCSVKFLLDTNWISDLVATKYTIELPYVEAGTVLEFEYWGNKDVSGHFELIYRNEKI